MDLELSGQSAADKGMNLSRWRDVPRNHLIAGHPVGTSFPGAARANRPSPSAGDRQLKLLSDKGREFAGSSLDQRS
jgi:hypothetical protein